MRNVSCKKDWQLPGKADNRFAAGRAMELAVIGHRQRFAERPSPHFGTGFAPSTNSVRRPLAKL